MPVTLILFQYCAACSLQVNITCVLLGVFVPLPFALAHLKDGFVNTTNPTIFCIGRNGDTVFYTLILPISIFVAAITCMQALLFCHIVKVSCLELEKCLSIEVVE